MSGIQKRNSLSANPDVFMYPHSSDINITSHGANWYWAVTAVMIVSTMVFVGLSFTVPRRNRIFHYITASITLVASVAYFTMGSNLGYAAIPVEYQRSNSKVAGVLREIFYVRYIDWVVTTPLLLTDLLLTAGLPWPTILYTILLDEVMVITGLVGALVTSSYKWGYFVFAMIALIYIAYNVCYVARLHAARIGDDVRKTFLLCGVWTIGLWFIYPIAWGLSEGGNVISPDSEAVFYGILDILAKPVFGALLLWGHRNIDPARLGIHIRDYDDPMPYSEKNGGIGSAAANQHNVADSSVINGTRDGSAVSGAAVSPHTAPNHGTTAHQDTLSVPGTHANQSAA